MSDVLKAMDAEIAGVERDIAANPDPRLAKLENLRRVRAMYARISVSEHPRSIQAELPVILTSSAFQPVTDNSTGFNQTRVSTHQRALQEARNLLAHRGKAPVPLGEIFNQLERAGIAIGGKTPKNTLSAMLSNSDYFQAHGRSGWTLKDMLREYQNAEASDTNPPKALSEASLDHPLAKDGTHE